MNVHSVLKMVSDSQAHTQAQRRARIHSIRAAREMLFIVFIDGVKKEKSDNSKANTVNLAKKKETKWRPYLPSSRNFYVLRRMTNASLAQS